MHVYLVKPGDTLEEIARRFRVTTATLARCNDLPAAPFLLPGQSLVIPSELEIAGTDGYCTYQVQAGDTLRTLSHRFGIPATWLSFCNALHEPALRTGDFLLLPYTKSFTRDSRQVELEPSTHPLGLFCMESHGSAAIPCTYRGLPELQVDAAGRLHFPKMVLEKETSALQSAEKTLFLCTLAGSDNILPDVAKAILHSDHAQQLILEGLTGHIRAAGGDGVIFSWQGLGPSLQEAYLSFVKEAGRRLSPMGLVVSLHVTSDSNLLKKTRQLAELATHLDHFFYEPVQKSKDTKTATASLQHQAPAPLVGVQETDQALALAATLLPAEKLWLVLHPVGLLTRHQQVVAIFSPHQALEFAYQHGSPLIREPGSELVWARGQCGADEYSVWMEDLWSLTRKMELLQERRWQGLALWEAGLYFPEAWQYLSAKQEVKKGTAP